MLKKKTNKISHNQKEAQGYLLFQIHRHYKKSR